MTTSETLFNHLRQLQKQADAEARYISHPSSPDVLPNDALYLARVANVKAVCELIQTMVNRSGRTLSEVLTTAIAPSIGDIAALYPYTQEALRVLVRDFGQS